MNVCAAAMTVHTLGHEMYVKFDINKTLSVDRKHYLLYEMCCICTH